MTPDEYVATILANYAVSTGPTSPAERAANAVAPTIRAWAGQVLNDLSFSGSYAKGTAVSLGTDVDLFISLSPQTQGSLKEIYESLFNRAQTAGWSPRRQNVSIAVQYSGLQVDLVPGRLQQGHRTAHSLYKRRGDTWVQTDVTAHINTVLRSARTAEIRAIKIWRDLRRLDWPSFYLELAVIESLSYKPTNTLAANVLSSLRGLAQALPTMRLVDPANTNNIVSDDLSLAEKRAIAAEASSSANEPYWESIIW